VAEAFASPLAGKRVVITRAASQSEALAKELSARGAIPTVLPLVEFADPENFAPLDVAIGQIERFAWTIFTSAQAVRAVAARSRELGCSLTQSGKKIRIAVVGPVTAEAAAQAGLSVAYVARTHTGVALAEELGEQLRGEKVFLPRSDRANPDLPAALRTRGAEVTEAIAYRTLRPTDVERQDVSKIAEGDADAVLFFSPTAVQHFWELLGSAKWTALQDRLAITAVGPVTAGALRKWGVQRIVLAEDTTAAAVVDALEEHFGGAVKQSAAGAKRE
jgi:uroporphyrinogen-III synthase